MGIASSGSCEAQCINSPLIDSFYCSQYYQEEAQNAIPIFITQISFPEG